MRQVYVGSDHQVKVGSFPTRGALDSDHTGNVLGFRLVFDEAYRVCRGGSRDYGANYARAAYRNGDYPGYHRGDLGFRLVADWDAT
jgi:hypothetical protein